MALADVFSSNNIYPRVGFALIIGSFVGCASTSVPEAPYVPEAPKWSDVPSVAPLPIDGKWKTSTGGLFYFEKGKGRILNNPKLNPLDVGYKNILRVGPGKFTMEGISWNRHYKKTAFSKGDIEIISPTEIVLRAYRNEITNAASSKTILTNVHFNNQSSFLQEFKDMGTVAGSSNIAKNQTPESNQSSQAAILVKDYLSVAATLDASATKRFLSETSKEDIVTEFQIHERNGWKYLAERTEIVKAKINTQDGRGTVVAKILFAGGNPPTTLGWEQTFIMAMENGLWKVTGMNPVPKAASSKRSVVAPISSGNKEAINTQTSKNIAYDELVFKAQDALTKLGYDPGPKDGLVGAKTAIAIRLFQKNTGIPITGKLNSRTQEKLGIINLVNSSGANANTSGVIDRLESGNYTIPKTWTRVSKKQEVQYKLATSRGFPSGMVMDNFKAYKDKGDNVIFLYVVRFSGNRPTVEAAMKANDQNFKVGAQNGIVKKKLANRRSKFGSYNGIEMDWISNTSKRSNRNSIYVVYPQNSNKTFNVSAFYEAKNERFKLNLEKWIKGVFGFSLMANNLSIAQANASTNNIKYIQNFLYILGHDPGPIDGSIGKKTRDAYNAAKIKEHWLLDTFEDIEAVVADLYILTIPVKYDGSTKPIGKKCSGSLTVSNSLTELNMGDCPGSHLFYVRQKFARTVQMSPIRYIVYDNMKGATGEFTSKISFDVKTEDTLKSLRGKRQFTN